MSGRTNTLAPSTTRRRDPLSGTSSSSWAPITPIVHPEPRRLSTPSTTNRAGRPLPRPRTSPHISTTSPVANPGRGLNQPDDRPRSAHSRADRNLPRSLEHARLIELPSSSIVTYVEEPHRPSRTPSRSSVPDTGPYLLRRSPRIYFEDVLPAPPRLTSNLSSRNTIMISFAPVPQHGMTPRTSPLPSHTGMSNDSMLVDEVVHTPTPFKGPLHASVKVVLDDGSNCLKMIGGARTGTAYSLAGHVVLTVPNIPLAGGCPDPTWRTRTRELKRLRVSFEGKSEYHDDTGRYQALQLCRVDKDLIPEHGQSQLLHNAPTNSSSSIYHNSISYALAFDVTVPGWLPASFSNELTSTSYGLVCEAEIGWASATNEGLCINVPSDCMNQSTASSMPIPIGSGFGAASRFLPRLAKSVATAFTGFPAAQWEPEHTRTLRSEFKTIKVVRHRAPSTTSLSLDERGNTIGQIVNQSEPAQRHFTLKPSEDSPSPIECMVSTPEIVDLDGPSLRVSVRLRARKMATSGPSTLPISEPSRAVPAGFMTSTDENGDVSMEDLSGSGAVALDSGSTIHPQSKGRIPSSIMVEERVKMFEIGMEVEEIERYSSAPAQTFASAFPIPDRQPQLSASSAPFDVGNTAFLSPPSHSARIHLLGLAPTTIAKANRSRTLLLGEDGRPRTYRFEGDGLDLGNGWRKVNIVVPLPRRSTDGSNYHAPSSETETPYLKLKHKLKIKLICRTASAVGAETVVCLTTPLRMSTSATTVRRTPCTTPNLSKPIIPLPAYNQIFHENGAIREDDDPLPLYEEPSTLIPEPSSPPSAATNEVESTEDAMELADQEQVLQAITPDYRSLSPIQPPDISRVSQYALPQSADWSSTVPSLVSSSGYLYSPSSTFASVPGPRTPHTPRSSSPSSFDEMNGLAFGAGTPEGLDETYATPGPLTEHFQHQQPFHDAVTRYQMLARTKGARNISGLSQLAEPQEMS